MTRKRRKKIPTENELEGTRINKYQNSVYITLREKKEIDQRIIFVIKRKWRKRLSLYLRNRIEDIPKSIIHRIELHKKNQSNWVVHILTTILQEKFVKNKMKVNI